MNERDKRDSKFCSSSNYNVSPNRLLKLNGSVERKIFNINNPFEILAIFVSTNIDTVSKTH